MAERTELLMQSSYLDSKTGSAFPASEIDYVAPYEPFSDGFYKWKCQACNHAHQSRAFGPLTGLVEKCDECGAANLLVATDTRQIAEARKLHFTNQERERELARLSNIEREALNRETRAISIQTGQYTEKIRRWITEGLEAEEKATAQSD